MNDLERFQAEHGAAWAATTQSPSFLAAFSIANIEKLQSIAALSDDEIATRGQVILADLRGHLNYETALISLHQPKKFVFQDLGPPTYPNPAEEIEEQPPNSESASTASVSITGFVPSPDASPILPKQKRKYRKRRKRQ